MVTGGLACGGSGRCCAVRLKRRRGLRRAQGPLTHGPSLGAPEGHETRARQRTVTTLAGGRPGASYSSVVGKAFSSQVGRRPNRSIVMDCCLLFLGRAQSQRACWWWDESWWAKLGRCPPQAGFPSRVLDAWMHRR